MLDLVRSVLFCLLLCAQSVSAEIVSPDIALEDVVLLASERQRATALLNVHSLSLPKPHLKVLLDELVAIWRHDEFKAEFRKRYSSGIERGHALRFSLDLFFDLVRGGVGLLAEDEQHEFIRFTREYLGFVKVEDCKLLILSPVLNSETNTRAQITYGATLPIERFTRVLSIYSKAALVALRKAPAEVVLTDEEARNSKKKRNKLARELFEELPPEIQADRAALRTAPADLVCRTSLRFLDAVLSLGLTERRGVVRVFLEEMRKSE